MFTYLILFSFLFSSSVTTYYIGYECDHTDIKTDQTNCKNTLINDPICTEDTSENAQVNYKLNNNGNISDLKCQNISNVGDANKKCKWVDNKCTDPSKDTSIKIKNHNLQTNYNIDKIIKSLNTCNIDKSSTDTFIIGLNRTEFKGSPKYTHTPMQLVSLAIMNIMDTWPNSCLTDLDEKGKCKEAWPEDIGVFYKKVPSPLNVSGYLKAELQNLEKIYNDIDKAIEAILKIINKGYFEENEVVNLTNLIKLQNSFNEEPFKKSLYYSFFTNDFGTNNTPPVYKISDYKTNFTCVGIEDSKLYFDKENKSKLNITILDGFKTNTEFDLTKIAPYIYELHKAKQELQAYINRLKILEAFDPKSKDTWLARQFRTFREWGFSGDIATNLLFDGVRYGLERKDLKDALARQLDPCKYELGNKRNDTIPATQGKSYQMTYYDYCVAMLRNQNNPCEQERLNNMASGMLADEQLAYNYQRCLTGPLAKKESSSASFTGGVNSGNSGSNPTAVKDNAEEKKDDKKNTPAAAPATASANTSNPFKTVEKAPTKFFPKQDNTKTTYTDNNPRSFYRPYPLQGGSKINQGQEETNPNTIPSTNDAMAVEDRMTIDLLRKDVFPSIFQSYLDL